MSAHFDFSALLSREPFDQGTIERLKRVDREALRAALETYLPDEEVAGILRRIDALTKV